MKVVIKVDNSIEWQARKLLFLVRQLYTGFYGENNFLLVDPSFPLPHTLEHKAVLIDPRLYQYINESKVFKELVHEVEKHFWITAEMETVVDELAKYFGSDIKDIFPIKNENYHTGLSKTEDEFLSKLVDMLDSEKLSENDQITINMHNSLIGTGSFNSYKSIHVFPTPRISSFRILSMIVNPLCRKIMPGYEWRDYMFLTEFLLRNLSISINDKSNNISFDSIPNIQNLGHILEHSKDNYHKLNLINSSEKTFGFNGNLTIIRDTLTAKELQLFNLLFDRIGEIVTYEEIGDVIWSDGEEYSLQAISKIIERVRKKIINISPTHNYIFTEYGKGFLMVA